MNGPRPTSPADSGERGRDILPLIVVVSEVGLIVAIAGWLGDRAGLIASVTLLGPTLLIALTISRRTSAAVREIRQAMGDDAGSPGSDIVRELKGHLDSLGSELQDLRQEAAFLRRILASMSEAVLVLNPSIRTVFANDAAIALFGEDPTIPAQALDQSPYEFSVRLPDARTLRANSSALEEGGWLVVVQDVTVARHVDAVRRDFVANVSHELKTPVAGILASAETLEVSMREDPDAAEGFMHSLLREAKRLSRMVEDLLDLARLEQEPQGIEDLDLTALISVEVDKATELAGAKGLTLHSDLEAGVHAVGISVDLALAVRNLLVNAIKYTEQGMVSVGLTRRGGSAVVEVTDTGVGIPAKDLPRIFERFYRVDKARSRETGGTGLGLSIVRHVAEQHSGEVHARSELQRGSTFTFTIPLTRSGPQPPEDAISHPVKDNRSI